MANAEPLSARRSGAADLAAAARSKLSWREWGQNGTLINSFATVSRGLGAPLADLGKSAKQTGKLLFAT